MCLGIPGQIIRTLSQSLRMGEVSFGGALREVCLEYVPEAEVGDYVIVHAGFAISRLDAAAAERALETLSAALAPEEP